MNLAFYVPCFSVYYTISHIVYTGILQVWNNNDDDNEDNDNNNDNDDDDLSPLQLKYPESHKVLSIWQTRRYVLCYHYRQRNVKV